MTGELDLAGVFLSGAVASALMALLATALLRRLLAAVGLYRHLWHPALFDAALFLVLWATLVALKIGP
jgi:hypothetical protein